ncbi:hypothetical protein OGR47_17750 [Methylocystis sp. MJC1]|jgi:hypothetical protein|uniref:hypothetical protein n=1 Tax=Methylocystis sp. MJC1 TaxID=2654282 RepID=UPI0013EA2EA8|nr:hypothetical protein [Methylocystis sp. MJC1]KAF2989991.1 hypothetical protein MJC1_02908 [Methylocystis sp. MJC1]MBU6528803.1 hypothetical protein [Methylocystis sp. MJC1]UZX11688.1 hypothetical protein OGR47_17750 [Methylocystis sp. MJC1]
MSESFSLVIDRHGAFGVLATLRIAAQPARRFTLQEAAIVARALEAVAQGVSGERQIYMSPIASDHDFEASVEKDGVIVRASGCAEARLSWPETLALAEQLREASSG